MEYVQASRMCSNSYTRATTCLGQLRLQRLNLRGERLHLLRLHRDRLGLLRDHGFDRFDFTVEQVR